MWKTSVPDPALSTSPGDKAKYVAIKELLDNNNNLISVMDWMGASTGGRKPW